MDPVARARPVSFGMTRAATAGAARVAQPLLGGEPSRKNALSLAPTSARCRREKQKSRLPVQKRLVGPHEALCLRHPSSEEVRTRAEIPFSLPSRRRARRARQARHRSSGPMGKRVATHHPHVRLRRGTAATRPGARPLALAALRAHASARARQGEAQGSPGKMSTSTTGWWSFAGSCSVWMVSGSGYQRNRSSIRTLLVPPFACESLLRQQEHQRMWREQAGGEWRGNAWSLVFRTHAGTPLSA
jgi:hypothetical protein